MDKVSKLQKLLPYDWRIVNELKRELTDDEYAVCVSWLAFMDWTLAFRSRKDVKEIVKSMASISKEAKIDFCHFFGLGDEKAGTIYINRSHGQVQRDLRNAKSAVKYIPDLEGVN